MIFIKIRRSHVNSFVCKLIFCVFLPSFRICVCSLRLGSVGGILIVGSDHTVGEAGDFNGARRIVLEPVDCLTLRAGRLGIPI